MANECKIFEMDQPRGLAPIRKVPFLARQQLSSGGTATLNKSTTLITVVSSLAGTVDFEATDGTDPTGSLAPFPIAADMPYDFDVRPGSKVRFD